MDSCARFSFNFWSCSSKQLRPVRSHRNVSAITVLSVYAGRYSRSDYKTLVTIVRRRVPAAVLLVRPVLRASAGFRSVRSASLFVPPTGMVMPLGCFGGDAVTKVNKD